MAWITSTPRSAAIDYVQYLLNGGDAQDRRARKLLATLHNEAMDANMTIGSLEALIVEVTQQLTRI